MQHYQKIRAFLTAGNKLNLFEADLRPIDDLISTCLTMRGYLNENQPCLGLNIMGEIAVLLEKREHSRAVVQRIIRDNGIFEDAALQMNATINLISKKLVELDSWVMAEHDQLLVTHLEQSAKYAWEK